MEKNIPSLEDKVLKTIEKYELLESGNKVLVAVSGGPDSIALLHLFTKLKALFNLKLHVFHLDHKMREDSFKDALFVEKQAQKYRLPATILSYDVLRYAKDRGLSLQEGARQIRYDLLKKTAAKIKADKIALGHQADDQIETFLMRLIRGAGLQGLQGIPSKRGKIIRPLIETARPEIEKYLQENNLEFRFDSTNLNLVYLRNRVRQQLIPLLREINPNIGPLLLQTIRLIATDEEWLEDMTQKELKKILEKEKNLLKIPLLKLDQYPLALKQRILRQGVKQIKGDLRRMEFKHIERLLQKIEGKENFQNDLPGNLVVLREYNNIVITTKNYFQPGKILRIKLKVPGITAVKAWGLKIEAKYLDSKEFDLKNLDELKENKGCYLDGEKVKPPLFLRARKPGDRFIPLGMSKEKKLQDFFVDEKVPKTVRNQIPIIHTDKQILWVVGYRIDNRVKIMPDTKKILQLKIEKD